MKRITLTLGLLTLTAATVMASPEGAKQHPISEGEIVSDSLDNPWGDFGGVVPSGPSNGLTPIRLGPGGGSVDSSGVTTGTTRPGSVTSTATTTGTTGPGSVGPTDLTTSPAQDLSVPWPIPEPVGRLHHSSLSAGRTPPSSLPPEIPQSAQSHNFRTTSFRGQAGSRVAFDLWADFDCVFHIVDPQGRVIAGSDDFQGQLNHSRVDNLVLPSDGRYRVIITSYEAGDAGEFWFSAGRAR